MNRTGNRQLAQTYRTDDVHARDRFAYWREAICDAYVHLGCENRQRAGFDGRISLHELSSVRASFVASDAQHVYRRRRDISRGTEEFFLLSIQMRGIGRIQQHQREAILTPGDFALYASTDPYELVFDNPFEQLVIQVPKQAVIDRLPIADMLTASAISGRRGAGKLVSDCLIKIAAGADRVEPACQTHISTSVIDLLCSGLPLVNGRTPEDTGPQDQLTTLRIEAFIASNLKNPSLNRADGRDWTEYVRPADQRTSGQNGNVDYAAHPGGQAAAHPARVGRPRLQAYYDRRYRHQMGLCQPTAFLPGVQQPLRPLSAGLSVGPVRP